MKTVVHTSNSRDKLLHIETDMGIVNIRVGLCDNAGRKVTSIEILKSQYVGEPVTLDGHCNNRLIEGDVPLPPALTPAQAAASDLLAALNKLCVASGEADALHHAGMSIPNSVWSEIYQSNITARAAIARANGEA